MAESAPEIGSIAWTDLTVKDASAVRDFYAAVVGWKAVAMGDYRDYNMCAPGSGTGVAGLCHARGVNADPPAPWLVHIVVEDVDAAAARCAAKGGRVLVGPKPMGGGRYCVTQDPAGAVCALTPAKA